MLIKEVSLENVHYFYSPRHLEMGGSSTIIMLMRKFCPQLRYELVLCMRFFCMETRVLI